MPSVAVKLYSVFFKFMLKRRLQSRMQDPAAAFTAVDDGGSLGVTSRQDEESIAAANPTFADGVATKDIHIDPLTSLSIRIFLPETCLAFVDPTHLKPQLSFRASNSTKPGADLTHTLFRHNSYGAPATNNKNNMDNNNNNNNNNNVSDNDSFPDKGSYIQRAVSFDTNGFRRNSYGGSIGDGNVKGGSGIYRGYSPMNIRNCRKLPVMLQFHGGGFVSGSNESVANDIFCRRMAKLCDVIVLAVGYRLAPENKYPAAFEDGLKVLHWLAKQANLAECNKSLVGSTRGGGGGDLRKSSDGYWHVADAFGASMVEPWLAAHGDPSRCVLLGASCGGNIADYLARKAVEVGKLLDPVKVVAQVLMYPFFIGSVPTHSEIKLANSYFYDKPMCMLAWKLFLPEEFDLDHPAANPLLPGRAPPLKYMPPTLTIVAEHDWMRDRAIAYSEELRKVNVVAPVLEYKDAVHEFATLDMLLKTPQALVCAEDIAIWVKKYISLRGHEFSY